MAWGEHNKALADLLTCCVFCVFDDLLLGMVLPSPNKKKFDRKRAVFKFLHNPNTKWSHAYHSVVCTFLCTHAIMQNFYLDYDQYRDYFMWKHLNKTWSQPMVNSGIFKTTSERSLDVFTLVVDASLSGLLKFMFAFPLFSFFIFQHFSFWRLPCACGPRLTFPPTLVA